MISNILMDKHGDLRVVKRLRYVVEKPEYIDEVNSVCIRRWIGLMFIHLMSFRCQMYRGTLTTIWSSLLHDHICPFIAINCSRGSVPTIELPYYREGNILDYNRHSPNADKIQQVRHAHYLLASYAHILGVASSCK